MTVGHDIAMALRAAYLAMHRQTDARLAPHGVTADQFVLLSALAGGDGVTQQELVRRTSSDPNTVRAMLLLLERRRLVARTPHPTDGRARSVTLTRKGRDVYEQLWAAGDAVRAALVAALRQDEARAFIDLLGRVTDAVADAAVTEDGRENGRGPAARKALAASGARSSRAARRTPS